MFKNEHIRRLAITLLLLVGSFVFGTFGYWFMGRICDYEGWTLFKCAYMTMVTLSTVGYSDPLLIDGSGNYFAMGFTLFLMMVGMGIVVYCMSQLTAMIVEGDIRKLLKRKRMKKAIEATSGHYIVCGAGATGRPVLEELLETNRKVVVIDQSLEILEDLNDDRLVGYIVGDALDDDILREAGIERAAGIFSILSADKDNLFVTVTARGLNSRMRIVSKAIDLKIGTKLIRSGANAVVSPNTIGGMRMASEMVRPSVVKFLDKMLRGQVPNRIEEVHVEKDSVLDGKTIREAHIHKQTGLLVIAIIDSDTDAIVYNPGGETKLDSKTVLVTMGNNEQIQQVVDLAQNT